MASDDVSLNGDDADDDKDGANLIDKLQSLEANGDDDDDNDLMTNGTTTGLEISDDD